jgi:predicted amidohydrolase YtcJ
LSAIGAEGSDGRMFRQDEWLRLRRPASDPPDLGHLSDRLASFGVTGVTDATPSDDLSSVQILGQAVIDGTFAQEITVMGSTCLAHAPWVDGVRWGPVKFIIGDHELPTFDEICDACRLAHANGRTFAVHCVTPVALALALAAWEEVGVRPGDRIEHGSVIVPDAAERLAELGLEVVTQPGLIASRGDGYQRDVEANLLPYIYSCASLLARGVKVGGSTDAPYGELDPWKAIAAAMSRRTASGEVLNPAERLEPERALELFLTTPADPGGPPRKIAVGAGANVCLLDAPLAAVMEETSSEHVVATIIGGRVVYHR